MSAGDVIEETHALETTWVLMTGKAQLEFSGRTEEVERGSIFDDAPTCLNLGPGTHCVVTAHTDCEWAVVRVDNDGELSPRLFRPEDLTPEYRGKGLVQDACLRNVRLIFDDTVFVGSNMVIGEVINYPGRWSSYPPHHHAQDEIYHYRFSETQGYGHAELGERVYRVNNGDTIRIPGGLDHSQVSAPGYAMYYLWVVRHQADNHYRGFEFTEDHRWLLSGSAQGWTPKEGPR